MRKNQQVTWISFKSVRDYIKKGKGDTFEASLGIVSFLITAVTAIFWNHVSNLGEYPFAFILSIGLCMGELTVRILSIYFNNLFSTEPPDPCTRNVRTISNYSTATYPVTSSNY